MPQKFRIPKSTMKAHTTARGGELKTSIVFGVRLHDRSVGVVPRGAGLWEQTVPFVRPNDSFDGIHQPLDVGFMGRDRAKAAICYRLIEGVGIWQRGKLQKH